MRFISSSYTTAVTITTTCISTRAIAINTTISTTIIFTTGTSLTVQTARSTTTPFTSATASTITVGFTTSTSSDTRIVTGTCTSSRTIFSHFCDYWIANQSYNTKNWHSLSCRLLEEFSSALSFFIFHNLKKPSYIPFSSSGLVKIMLYCVITKLGNYHLNSNKSTLSILSKILCIIVVVNVK